MIEDPEPPVEIADPAPVDDAASTSYKPKKSRRGKGRNKAVQSEGNDGGQQSDEMNALTEAARQLAISHSEMVDLVIGAATNHAGKMETEKPVKKSRSKKKGSKTTNVVSESSECLSVNDGKAIENVANKVEVKADEKAEDRVADVINTDASSSEPNSTSPPKSQKNKKSRKKKVADLVVADTSIENALAKENSVEDFETQSKPNQSKAKSSTKKKGGQLVDSMKGNTSAFDDDFDFNLDSPMKGKQHKKQKYKKAQDSENAITSPVKNEDLALKSKSKKTQQKSNNMETQTPALIEPTDPESESSNSTSAAKKKKKRKSLNVQEKQNLFPNHWTVQRVLEGLVHKKVKRGVLRINKKNYREAYIPNPDGGMDILFDGVMARNRAMEGDEVAVELLPEDQWKVHGDKKQCLGTVIGILAQEHQRQAVGTLKAPPEISSPWVLFSPRDGRVPRMRVPSEQCPPNFHQLPDMMYLAEIIDWTDVRYAMGSLVAIVGMSGNIQAETQSILLENGLDVRPYEPEMAAFYPTLPYQIPWSELNKREDFRKLCIFTIDPATARDLDDAVSCRPLPGGQGLEVGVHISDVSFFLEEKTPLDTAVCARATSTYLTQTVFHMLPLELCKLCSLTPGEDKVAFSVIWHITKDGKILSPPRFTRSVIHSACQLSYEHAQKIIDNPDKKFEEDEFPTIHGGFTQEEVVSTVLLLQPLAKALRDARFAKGALRIDQPKLHFTLDPDSGLPDAFHLYVNMECHRLIEELMLLANTTVAQYIHARYPDIAFLRCHPPPHDHMLPELQSMLKKCGVDLDISSSGSIHKSLSSYLGSTDPKEQARGWALSAMLSKPMARAKYFCTHLTQEEDMWHYALCMQHYTHFTSPIRRYADIMVHRLLSAALGYTPRPRWDPDYVQHVASVCNGKKYSAKRAGEQSIELFLQLFVAMNGPLIEDAVVMDIKDHSFDVMALHLGSTHRVYTNNLKPSVAKAIHREVNKGIYEVDINWANKKIGTQVIKLFSVITIELKKTEKEGDLKIEAKIYPSKTDT